MLVLDPNRTIEVLARLHEMGVRVSLDDFGTGWSSLSYLQRLPVDELKIDRSFICDLAASDTDSSIVEATVALARNLGLTTVAEGVETAETWDQLVRLGCDVAQGYFISRPLPADELEAWLAGVETHAAIVRSPSRRLTPPARSGVRDPDEPDDPEGVEHDAPPRSRRPSPGPGAAAGRSARRRRPR